MSRNIDRDTQRRLIKLNNWKKNWTSEQKIFYRAEVEKEIDKVHDMTEKVLDSCYISAIGDYTDLELEKIIEITKKANLYMQDCKIFITDKEKGEQYFMQIENNELREEIKKVIRKQIKEGKLKSKALVELKNEFDMPANFLSNLWMEVKSEKEKAYNKHTPTKIKDKDIKVNIPASEEEKEQFLKEIGVDMDKKINGEVATDIELPYVIEEKELEKEMVGVDYSSQESASIRKEDLEALKELVIGEEKPPQKLKIKLMEIEGQHGLYYKGVEGVKVGNSVYKDITDVEEEKNAYIRRMTDKEEEIKATIKKLQNELNQRVETKKHELEKYAEIEQVFNL